MALDDPRPNGALIIAPRQLFQRSIAPLVARTIHPNSSGSADLKNIVTANNGRDYAVKCVSDGNKYVPASEMFCYEIARDLAIPTPDYQFIQMPSGEIGFGSAWEGGAKIANESYVIGILTGSVSVRGITEFLSRVYAMDIFVNNVDRHWGNFIFRDSFRSVIALAYDFGRAWYASNPYSFDAFGDCNTRLAISLAVAHGKYDPAEALQTLETIENISSDRIEAIFEGMPSEWLAHLDRQTFLQWWSSEYRIQRIASLKASL